MYNMFAGKFLGYTYENMVNDLGIFSRVFQGILYVDSLGRTVDGREIFHLLIGHKDAQEKILIFGGIHGREYMTSQLLMELAAEFLTKLNRKEEQYRGQDGKSYAYEELLNGRAIHVIPMANPDGISISQFGIKGIRKKKLSKVVENIASEEGGRFPCGPYFTKWKANARGVDLNRNFDALWAEFQDERGRPSSEKYKGTEPESEVESKVLAELTRRERFARTISYHSSGQVIYWNFNLYGKLKETTVKFAERIAAVTGYTPVEDFADQAPAGYKDWALMQMKIPSITVEIGRMDSPLPEFCFQEILRENRGVFEETLLEIM